MPGTARAMSLHGVDLDVGEGETVTLLGRNGVGKTTTLRTIMGIVRKRTARSRFDGNDLIGCRCTASPMPASAIVPEERGIFATPHRRGKPAAAAGRGARRHERRGDLRAVPQPERAARSQGTKLSGGEQQMLAIARILRTGVEPAAARRADRGPRAGDRPADRRGAGDAEGARHDHPAGRAELPFRQPHRRPLLSDGAWQGGRRHSRSAN